MSCRVTWCLFQFEQNKLLGMKVSEWHVSLVSKLLVNESRGALNMNVLADSIMNSFEPTQTGTLSTLTFEQLVRNQHRKDVSRYFLACLQLVSILFVFNFISPSPNRTRD